MTKQIKANNKNFQQIIKLLKKHYPKAKCALYFNNPLELLIATILSAQCTDFRVNMVTPKLFKKYQNVKSFAEAVLEELQFELKSINFYKNKAKNIQAACKLILEKFKGEVPQTMEELLELPGVARKTANVVLSNAYNLHLGIVVDTHVTRLSQRLGFTEQTKPLKIEQDLLKIVPAKDWGIFSHLLIEHGRKVCKAQKPLCGNCFLRKICPYGIAVLKEK